MAGALVEGVEALLVHTQRGLLIAGGVAVVEIGDAVLGSGEQREHDQAFAVPEAKRCCVRSGSELLRELLRVWSQGDFSRDFPYVKKLSFNDLPIAIG